ncbi:selenium metabolism protein YedF [Alkalithermobacter thermoalcaliphilus JW-YL-7 = DSM 7308]|uniref:Selenium metabolism protein YedF n=1 Tax=Alkalithermobacter thermoalcaliphilus JW-YL-7 = DSM 7308 TaxID=1121328 RepID=A0A150FT32_CLOPD|nr:selenium metabolism protein YedF [[Clostridium] paradoxum JW-YL-7 = DSM 7308]SHL09054.1 selenium metabolism protein YedF [[Clostridium] paradoxum JW-YL-7 = DSM 7308]
MKYLDARNLECPKPVINTKKELESITEGTLVVIVDNEIAKENVLKLAKSMNCLAVSSEKEDGIYIQITKGNLQEDIKDENVNLDITDKVIMISSEFMGKGSDELGKILIKGFLYTISESGKYPKSMLFINSGVKLTTENEETVESLKKLESQGVDIQSCGTCLDYFNLKDKLKVGKISNMYDIVDTINKSSNTIVI